MEVFQQFANSHREYTKALRSVSRYNIKFLGTYQWKIKKANKGISFTKNLNLSLPRSSLITIHKSFVRSSVDYSYMLYDQPNNANDRWPINDSLSDKIESVYLI